MLNLTPDSIVFNTSGAELASAVEASIKLAAEHSLTACGLENIDLDKVTTKTHLRAAFAKFVYGRILRAPGRLFDRAYVECAFDAYKQKIGHLTREHFHLLMAADEAGPYSYKASYAIALRPGLGIFLVALHSSGAVTLPATFPWPLMRQENPEGFFRRLEVGKQVASELLAFVRSLDSQSEALPHPAFQSVGGDRKRREWFLTYATKLLLASGWHRPEDVNLEDLLSIKAAEREVSGKTEMPLAFKALLDVINLGFPGRVQVSSADWATALKEKVERSAPGKGRATTSVSKALRHLFENGFLSDNDLFDEVLHLSAAWGNPKRVRTIERLPGLDVDIRSVSELWLDLEELYMRKIVRESYKAIYSALGWWNVYLFFYLPYWFDRNSDSSLTFPSAPSLLIKSVFVSRLLDVDEARPVTFMEFMNAQAERKEWKSNSYYATLKGIQGFFAFLELYSDEIPGCEGFTQPLSSLDYPKTSRAVATNKKPVPRRFFGVYLDYFEALLAHHGVVTNKILAGEITSKELRTIERNGGVIDTFSTGDLVGYIPVIFTKSRTIPLQFMPNVLDSRPRIVRGGRSLNLPHPHSLHQNLVALHTGVRHNHIQWLDKDKFDSLVGEEVSEFSLLFVNTDKQKKEPWTPYVNFRVIELLRAQREWCDLIEEVGFHSEHFYNGNSDTKWPKFRPLFAYYKNGKPHNDSKYAEVWQAALCGLQGLMPELPEFGRSRQLLRLLPPGHFPNDPGLETKLVEYGAQFQMGQSCSLKVATSITPHSARVAVVSQYITFLPTDLIGRYITGQKAGVVTYYVHLDQETLEVEQVHQAARMRAAVLRGACEPILSGAVASTTFVHADNVNCALARGIKSNLGETIAAFGGMSISFTEKTRRGVDVLRETGGADVAFNKTEVCPYGNNCPPDIVKELNGLRRCGLCQYAVRFIDHLPAVLAKKRQVAEEVDQLENLLATDTKTLNAKYSSEELDILEEQRSRLCEDLAGWALSEEVLEVIRHRIAAGHETRTWTVQKPEIIQRDLRRVSTQTTASEYLLARLGESIAFPILESPQVRARFDLLRRELLVRAGSLREAFSSSVPVDPAAECAGLLKTVIASTGMTLTQLAQRLEHDAHLADLPKAELRLLAVDEDA